MPTDKILNRRIDEIECLRGIAILFTLFHHVPLSLFIQPTPFMIQLYSRFTFWGGVDLFFVISGFVIMRSFSSRLTGRMESFWEIAKRFWLKRGFRILPVAWAWLAIFLIFTKFVNASGAFGSFDQNVKDAIPAVLQYANIYGVYSKSVGPNDIYWSLSIEEQFYILLPLVVFLFKKKLSWFLIAIAILQFFISRPEWSLGWAIRTDALIWGVLIALCAKCSLYKRIEPAVFGKYSIFGAAISVVCILGIAYFPAKQNQFAFGTGIVALFAALFVWVASYNKSYLFKPGIIKRILMWLGTRSYSLYLTHILIYRFAHELFYQLTPVGYRPVISDSYKLIALAVPLLLVTAELSFRWIEQPFRRLGRTFAKQDQA